MNMKKFKLKKGFIVKKIGYKITIYDGNKSVLYTLNTTGSYIFSKLKLGWNQTKIISSLIKKYYIHKESAQKDLNALIKDLLAKKIITQTVE